MLHGLFFLFCACVTMLPGLPGDGGLWPLRLSYGVDLRPTSSVTADAVPPSPRGEGSTAANHKLSRKLQPFPRTQKVPRRASSAGDFTSDSALIQLKALKAVFTWPWGRQPRYWRAYWGTSWRSSPGTWRPACWPARRKQPYPPTCRGHPASRRARRGSWWDSPR